MTVYFKSKVYLHYKHYKNDDNTVIFLSCKHNNYYRVVIILFAVINIPIFDIRTTKFSNGRFQHDFDFVTLCKFFAKFDNGPESVLVTN